MTKDELYQVANRLRWTAYNTYRCCLVGNPCAYVKEQLLRMTTLCQADLVAEISSIHSHPELTAVSVGTLMEVRREPFPNADLEAYREGGQEVPLETVYYTRDLRGRVRRWTNCTFIAVPVWSDPTVWPEPKNVMLESAHK